MSRRWWVAQIGAREHYAAARAFERCGRLERLYTDAWAGRWSRLLELLPGPARALAGRFHPELRGARVTAFNASALRRRARAALHPPRDRDALHRGFLAEGAQFGRRIAARLRRAALDPQRDAYFTYDTGALEPLLALRERGVPGLVSQIDPARVEEELVAVERARWPDWERDPGSVPEAYWERLASEWSAATRVVVNSEWSREALAAQGVDAAKLCVVPLAYEPERVAGPRPKRAGTLRVLFLGLVCLRKGIPYLLEAARRLADRDLSIAVAGPLQVSDRAIAGAPANVRFLGRVQRADVARAYEQADLFVFPTISDGFGITQLEAMAHGLPVIATTRCGQVVTPGEDGLIVPPADAEALAEAIARLDGDREQLAAMSAAATNKLAAFSLERFAERLDLAAVGT